MIICNVGKNGMKDGVEAIFEHNAEKCDMYWLGIPALVLVGRHFSLLCTSRMGD